MLIATTRWIHFCQLCPWFKSHPKYGPVRHEGGYREKCATSMCLSSLCRIACQFLHVGISPYGWVCLPAGNWLCGHIALS